MTKFIAIPLGYLLNFLYGIIDNYGISLIIFTLIVRACLFPLYANQIKHSLKMQDMQPKLQALQKKYANDKETLNAKMMELYKEENFNPMRGCLPMVIQLPIIWGLFALLRNPMKFIHNDAFIMAVHEPLLWIKDLSQPDLWMILPILAGVATFFSYTVMTSQNAGAQGAAGQTNTMMKMMKYFFPIMIVWMGRSFPAGLALYWFVGTTEMVAQSFFMNKWKKKKMAQLELEKMKGKAKKKATK